MITYSFWWGPTLFPGAKGANGDQVCQILRSQQDNAVSEQFPSSCGQVDLDYAGSGGVNVQELAIQ